ncbi:hypothetical protein OIU85_024731 [Salix viminalis]|uniref:Uncharacterized protein n=1 Tax=Salix viminalis TaxID=40686 RepID=A0A9Q0U1B5_SALVM|nr:hypothetical protein OIU85_024731 [Salix viminalis]
MAPNYSCCSLFNCPLPSARHFNPPASIQAIGFVNPSGRPQTIVSQHLIEVALLKLYNRYGGRAPRLLEVKTKVVLPNQFSRLITGEIGIKVQSMLYYINAGVGRCIGRLVPRLVCWPVPVRNKLQDIVHDEMALVVWQKLSLFPKGSRY